MCYDIVLDQCQWINQHHFWTCYEFTTFVLHFLNYVKDFVLTSIMQLNVILFNNIMIYVLSVNILFVKVWSQQELWCLIEVTSKLTVSKSKIYTNSTFLMCARFFLWLAWYGYVWCLVRPNLTTLLQCVRWLVRCLRCCVS